MQYKYANLSNHSDKTQCKVVKYFCMVKKYLCGVEKNICGGANIFAGFQNVFVGVKNKIARLHKPITGLQNTKVMVHIKKSVYLYAKHTLKTRNVLS